MSALSLYTGIDIGTSGCRVVVIDTECVVHARTEAPLPAAFHEGPRVEQTPEHWWRAARCALRDVLRQVSASEVRAIAVDGTSNTVLLADSQGVPLGPALMYNDSRSRQEADRIARTAPATSGAHGATSSLAKLLHLQGKAPHAHHGLAQADWIAGNLSGRFDTCDENNALKMGYDPIMRTWPDWLFRVGLRTALLPRVIAPGDLIGTVATEIATEFRLRPDTQIIAGTTDSVAGFLATGAQESGEAVTSLGSTLVLKVLSETPIFAPKYGVYSHRLGDRWLAGGASNSGGAVLLRFFSVQELEELEQRLNPSRSTGLDYYPLLEPGERFPINDVSLEPRLTPRPKARTVFYQALLEGMARIEQRGYGLLAELGAPRLTRVQTVGGGAKNAAWTEIRARMLGVPVTSTLRHNAAYGAALLARQGAISTSERT